MMFTIMNLNRALFKTYCYIHCNLRCLLEIKSKDCRKWMFGIKLISEVSTRRSCVLMNMPHQHANNTMLLRGDHINRRFSSEDEFVDYEIIDDFDDKATSNSLRNFLYPDSEDPITVILKDVSNVQQVFDILNENYVQINGEHCGQAIISLWDLQRQCKSANDMYSDVYLFKNQLFRSYTNQLRCHDMFPILLDLLDKHSNDLSMDALSCSILYVMKMGVNCKNNVLENLILKFEGLLDSLEPGCIPVTALSRFSLAIAGQYKLSVELHNKITLIKIIPHLNYWLEQCKSVVDHKLVTICMYSLSSVVTEPLLTSYLLLTLRLLESKQSAKEIDDNVAGIIKSISLLCFYINYYPVKAELIHKTVVKLLMSLIGKLDKVAYFQQFYSLQKAFSLLLEPAPFEQQLKSSCWRWVDKCELHVQELTDVSPELLFCLVVNTVSHKQHRFADAAAQLAIKTDNTHDLLVLLSTQLRILGNLRNSIWPAIIRNLDNSPNLRDLRTLLQISSRYIDYCIPSRDRNLEKRLMELLFGELHRSSAGVEPNKLAHTAMFVLAFPEHLHHNKNVIETFIDKLLLNMDQFTLEDCQRISKGFRQFLINSFAGNTSHLIHYYGKLDAALTERTMDLLEVRQPEGSLLRDLNMACRSFTYRKGSPNSQVFHKIIECYNFVKKEDMTSRSIRNTVYNLLHMNVLLPVLLDKLCEYVVDNRDIILGGTVCKLLHATYSLGHSPNNETFFDEASHVVIRDIANLPGILLLQAALALSFHNRLNKEIVSYIFSIEFLDQLDSEVKYGYSTHSFPERIRRSLMELNRSVCLDYPECSVPWFHAKHCQQEVVTSNKSHVKLKDDVNQVLVSVINDKRLVQRDAQSLYGHNIDFQLCFDENATLLPPPCNKSDGSYLTKLAILLYNDSDFTLNERRLKGPRQMERRHLEILGFQVATIEETVWNAMYMTEVSAKKKYLADIIRQSICRHN